VTLPSGETRHRLLLHFSIAELMSAEPARPIYIAILGTDALLASRPADPVQVARACQTAGFDFVAPVSWGEELIAAHLADRLASADGNGSVIAAICPLARDQLSATPVETPVLSTVSPPVAAARYLRAAFQPRTTHITYVGACAGAEHPDIDVHCLPETLYSRFAESGIDPARQPRHLDGQLPAERARYASRPGGIPDCNWLMAHAGRRVVEAAPITADVVTQLYQDESVVIDLAAACRCVCARDRIAAARLEPPRSMAPVLGELRVAVTNSATTVPERDIAEPEVESDDRRAKFAENGLSSGEIAPIAPFEHTLTKAVEPW
jgi:hypothetical protein